MRNRLSLWGTNSINICKQSSLSYWPFLIKKPSEWSYDCSHWWVNPFINIWSLFGKMSYVQCGKKNHFSSIKSDFSPNDFSVFPTLILKSPIVKSCNKLLNCMDKEVNCQPESLCLWSFSSFSFPPVAQRLRPLETESVTQCPLCASSVFLLLHQQIRSQTRAHCLANSWARSNRGTTTTTTNLYVTNSHSLSQ